MTVAATDPSSHTESDQKMGYAKPGVTLPSPLKYKCTATGEKRAEPCATCNNSNNCMTDGLQIKEPTVDKLDEKSVVKLDAEGGVAACAKGDAAQCGYKPGAKVCGKCGAMATQIKVKDSDSGVGMEREKDEEAYDADNFAKAKVKDDAGEFCDCENYTGVEGGKCEKCGKPMAPVAMKGAFNVGMTAVDDPADEDFTARRKARPKKIFKPDAEKAAFAPGMTGVDHPMADDFTARRKQRHKKRLASMGMKMMEMDDEPQSSVGGLVMSLRQCMSGVVDLYFAAHGAHWNVEGPDFAQYHDLFSEIYNDVFSAIDPFAENIRKLGFPAPAGLNAFASTSPDVSSNSPRELVGRLIRLNGTLLKNLKAAFEVANDIDEQGIANFIAERIDQHQKWNWFLTSSAKSDEMKSLLEEIEAKSAEQSEEPELLAAPAGDLFLCGSTREIKSLTGASPCDDCTGGCVSMDARPDLLEIEAMAEDIIGGKALYSGYADEHDMFAVQVRRKDGKAVEAFFTGDGELDGWLRIPESEVFIKDANVVDINTAVEAALGAVEGKALAIAIGRLDDKEIYVVEVEGADGKSYDVHVATEGKVLSFDERITETKTIEPEAEVEVKDDQADIEAKDDESTDEKSAVLLDEQEELQAVDAQLSAALVELELLELDLDEE